ncbi:Aminotransferase class-V family protein [Aspergillus niger]|uniref:Aminotransferase class-V family protein n=1 Tax=Aspergillus niger TaxID=5061 RepID=A0A505HZC1_ASPNG|nr:Aminotransferase class-V family protein [Aspergillus niger]
MMARPLITTFFSALVLLTYLLLHVGHSTTQTEYLADCDPYLPANDTSSESPRGLGNPTFLALHVATTFRNTAAGSNISLSLDWWDHVNDTTPVWPGFPLSEAGLPRVTLFGYVEPFETPVPEAVESALTKCFLEKHPDAEAWLPGKEGAPHSSYWARLRVEQVYWIGGFGGLQRIGWLN